jgi:prepilin-type N-terminal cleavage/methylation domain-containing protein
MKTLKLNSARQNPGRQAGFTLMEVIIALAILAFGLFGTVSVISYTSRMNQASREQAMAQRAAEKKIEQMLSCATFDDIYTQFSKQTVGLGIDYATEIDPTGQTYALKALTIPPTGLVMPSGFAYPAVADPQATVFVRFPLSAGSSVGPTSARLIIAENSVVTFLDARDNNNNLLPGVDLNSDGILGQTYDSNLTAPVTPPTPPVQYPMTSLNLLPCWIEVHWSGVIGPSHLTYKYTFMRKS